MKLGYGGHGSLEDTQMLMNLEEMLEDIIKVVLQAT
jgi:hypothetical protein